MANLDTALIAHLDEVLADLDLSGATDDHMLDVVIDAREVKTVTAPAMISDTDDFYGRLPETDANELRAVASRIRHRSSKALIEIGNDLIKAKERLAGSFDKWLQLEFPSSKSTAWNMINAVQRFGAVPKVIEHLPQGVVYKLAAKATPDEVRQSIVREISDGADLTGTEVERRIDEAKAIAREARETIRKQQADDREWRPKANELKAEGKTDVEIEEARIAWNTDKARKKNRNAKAKLGRQHHARREAEELVRLREERKRIGVEAAAFLRSRLGPDFEAFAILLDQTDVWEFGSAMKEARSAAPTAVI